ncbi:MAG: hypothetical protein H7Y59_18375 [Anaerolineales bacterium]|nr:hypothetical protein [Anaerolineales bacterium]
MHKHKKHGHGHYFPGGMIWWFIFMMMFMKGEWWPWFLIPIGFWIVCGSMFKEDAQKPERKHPPKSHFDSAPPPVPRADPVPVPTGQIHRADLLPLTCPKCGGPVRSYEVKWTGAQSAACSYCGSNLPMKKT